MAIDTPPPIEALDCPLPVLEADLRALAKRQQLAGRGAEQRHLVDPLDRTWGRLAVEHPEACSTAADYPGWAEQLAALAESNRTPKEAS